MRESSFLKIFLCYGILFLAEALNVTEHAVEHPLRRWSPNRDPKFIHLRIPADSCFSTLADYQEGYCDGFASCLMNLGFISGICSNFLGACCVVKRSCGAQLVTRIGYFHNRGYPNSALAAGACSVTVKKYVEDVVQLRIDFLEFDLAPPQSVQQMTSTFGNCPGGGSFSVSGADTRFPVPTICGNNKGQHMYVNFKESGDITLNFKFDGTRSFKFHLKITQYRANHKNKAPDGCLQYFQTTIGTATSFNYIGKQHINNHNYDICVQKLGGANSDCVSWTFDDLKIARSPTSNGDSCFPNQDYIFIMQYLAAGSSTSPINSYCASTTTTTVKTKLSKISVVFNNFESNELSSTNGVLTDGTTGFKLSFSVEACP